MRDLIGRILALALVWVVVSEGRPEFWYYGVAMVVLGTATSVWLRPLSRRPLPRPRQLAAGVRLVGWAAWRAVLGAFDVARRAVGPRRWVEPVELELPARLPEGRGGLLAAALANLMPGTLIHRIDEHTVGMHALHPGLDAGDGWRELQERVGEATLSSGSDPA